METVVDYKEIVDEIKANGGKAFDRCYQCGLCDTVCPYCITHFEDSRLTLEDSESLVVKDITEIIQEAI